MLLIKLGEVYIYGIQVSVKYVWLMATTDPTDLLNSK